jgi:hypothetical protein
LALLPQSVAIAVNETEPVLSSEARQPIDKETSESHLDLGRMT